MSNKTKKAKAITKQFMQFIKDNKVSNACWFASGMLLAAKLYPAAMIVTIVGTANYMMDRVVDSGINQATVRAFSTFTPEQIAKLFAMVEKDMDEFEEEVIQQ
jgi:uncharacterized membrane protein